MEANNMAAMREAMAQQSVNDADVAAWILDKNPEDVCEERMSWSELRDMAYNLAAGFTTLRNAVKDTLAMPARNCDVGTLTEQQQRFHDYCEKMQHTDKACCGGCPIVHLRIQGIIDNGCELAWAYMSYDPAYDMGD